MMSADDGDQMIIEAESFSDQDSAYSTILPSTQSLSDTIKEHVWENGRSYHRFKKGKYMYPDDQKELDRLELLHHVIKLAKGQKLYHVPLEGNKIGNILDVGCGGGFWVVEIGDLHPEAKVLGVDLSTNMPTWVAPNVEFQVDDCEDEWTFREKFDFIHIANMIGSIKDWPRLVQQAYKFLKPGGWIEINEGSFRMESPDGSLPPDAPMMKWCKEVIDASAMAGVSITVEWDWEEMIKEAGFENTKVTKLVLPIGPWPKDKHLKEIGKWQRVNFVEAVQAITLGLFTRVLKKPMSEVEQIIKDVERDLKNSKLHVLNPFWVVCGQKPLEGST